MERGYIDQDQEFLVSIVVELFPGDGNEFKLWSIHFNLWETREMEEEKPRTSFPSLYLNPWSKSSNWFKRILHDAKKKRWTVFCLQKPKWAFCSAILLIVTVPTYTMGQACWSYGWISVELWGSTTEDLGEGSKQFKSLLFFWWMGNIFPLPCFVYWQCMCCCQDFADKHLFLDFIRWRHGNLGVWEQVGIFSDFSIPRLFSWTAQIHSSHLVLYAIVSTIMLS